MCSMWRCEITALVPLTSDAATSLQVQGSNADARELLLLARTINQTVGDAISGVLLVEAVLRCEGTGVGEQVWGDRQLQTL